MYRYLRVLGCDAADADDLTQDVFARFLRSSFEERSPAATLTYLRRTARHLFLDRIKIDRPKVIEWADAVDAEWRTSGAAEDSGEWVEALRACLGGLTQRSRDIVIRFYRGGQNRAVIARELGMSERGVRTSLHRARAILRECIQRRTGR